MLLGDQGRESLRRSSGVRSKKVIGDADGGRPRSMMVWCQITVRERRVERVKTMRPTRFLTVRETRGRQGKKRVRVHAFTCAHMSWGRCAMERCA